MSVATLIYENLPAALSHCFYIEVFHILSIFSFSPFHITFILSSPVPYFCQYASSFLEATTLESIHTSLSALCRLPVSYTPLFVVTCVSLVSSILFLYFFGSNSPFFHSSLLFNIWLLAGWIDTPVSHWSCSDLKAEAAEGNMRHFQTNIWAFSVSCNLALQFSEPPIVQILLDYVEKAWGDTFLLPTHLQHLVSDL